MKIAITGKMRSGKDTAANYFIQNYGLCQIAFGDGIKRIAKAYFPQIVTLGKPRYLYQTIGQDFRQFDPMVWVNDLDRTLVNHMVDGLNDFIVTDIRQMNEYEYLKAMGFTVIKIECADEIRRDRLMASDDVFDEEDFNHETETAVDSIPFDYLLTNNTTLEDLISQLQFVEKELLEEAS